MSRDSSALGVARARSCAYPRALPRTVGRHMPPSRSCAISAASSVSSSSAERGPMARTSRSSAKAPQNSTRSMHSDRSPPRAARTRSPSASGWSSAIRVPSLQRTWRRSVVLPGFRRVPVRAFPRRRCWPGPPGLAASPGSWSAPATEFRRAAPVTAARCSSLSFVVAPRRCPRAAHSCCRGRPGGRAADVPKMGQGSRCTDRSSRRGTRRPGPGEPGPARSQWRPIGVCPGRCRDGWGPARLPVPRDRPAGGRPGCCWRLPCLARIHSRCGGIRVRATRAVSTLVMIASAVP